jgi:GNAT superfamily N-acetyltransferase
MSERTAIPFELRSATSDDDSFLYRLYCTTREDELNAVNFPQEQREQFLQMQFIAQKTHYETYFPNSVHRIITTEGKPIGREYVYRSDVEILLLDLVLLPEFCSLGIGTVLLKRLFEESARTKKPLRLHALKYNNRALSLYERLGFYTIDDDGIYYFLEWRADRSQNKETNTSE